jgi:hypothetical protein
MHHEFYYLTSVSVFRKSVLSMRFQDLSIGINSMVLMTMALIFCLLGCDTVVLQVVTNISEDLINSVFKDEEVTSTLKICASKHSTPHLTLSSSIQFSLIKIRHKEHTLPALF